MLFEGFEKQSKPCKKQKAHEAHPYAPLPSLTGAHGHCLEWERVRHRPTCVCSHARVAADFFGQRKVAHRSLQGPLAHDASHKIKLIHTCHAFVCIYEAPRHRLVTHQGTNKHTASSWWGPFRPRGAAWSVGSVQNADRKATPSFEAPCCSFTHPSSTARALAPRPKSSQDVARGL